MSRMTSDIENLQQLLQDGLAQFAIQGLTMIVIAVFLFTTNVKLAFVTIVVVMPVLFAMSVWFKRASERGYDKVRDGIALVLADLSESLQGVRIVTAHNRQRYNVVHHRKWSASTATGLLHRAHQWCLRPGFAAPRRHRPSGCPGGGRVHGPPQRAENRSADDLLPLREPVLPTDPAPGAAVQLLPAGPGLDPEARAGAARDRAHGHRAADAIELPSISGEIRFDHVSFGYNPAVPVLEDVTLTIAPGETVAFVGTAAGQVHNGQAGDPVLRSHVGPCAH